MQLIFKKIVKNDIPGRNISRVTNGLATIFIFLKYVSLMMQKTKNTS